MASSVRTARRAASAQQTAVHSLHSQSGTSSWMMFVLFALEIGTDPALFFFSVEVLFVYSRHLLLTAEGVCTLARVKSKQCYGGSVSHVTLAALLYSYTAPEWRHKVNEH